MRILKLFVIATMPLLFFSPVSSAEMTGMSLQERRSQSDAVVVGTIEEVHQTDAGVGGQFPPPVTHWLATCRVERYIIGPKIHNPNVEEAKAVSLIRVAFEYRLQKPMLIKLVAGKKYLLYLKETGPNEYEMITPYHGAFEAGQDYFVHDEQSPEYPKAVKMSFEEIVQRVTPQNSDSLQPSDVMETVEKGGAGLPLRNSDDYVKVHYHPGYNMSDYVMDVVIEDAFNGNNPVISGVYKKLKEIEKSGRLEYVWPDAPSISIEVSHNGEVIKSFTSPHLSDSSNEFINFSRLWNGAYAIVWKSIENKLRPRWEAHIADKTLVPAEKASCEAQGGHWGKFGLMEKEQCNRPTTDAGKECSDHSECESDCVTEDAVPAGTEVTGKCFGWTVTLGTCMNGIKEGKAQGLICVD